MRFAQYTQIKFSEETALNQHRKVFFFFSIIHKSMLIKLVRMRNIVMVSDIKLLRKGMLMIVGTHTALGNAY